MRPIWKGSLSFGLVTIPITLYPATRREELKFRLLRASDHSPVNYKRVAEADGKEVPWDQIVKGYEYEKGKFVVLEEKDFKRVDVESTQTVEIMSFVKLDEINPVYFSKPYFMQPEKGGDKAYALLRDALKEANQIGLAKVVMKTRQHLAAVKPQGKGLMLELMHFPEELVDESEFKTPAKTTPTKQELKMAGQLIESMTEKWEPSRYHDDYHEALEKLIGEKIQRGGKTPPANKKARKPTNVIDLVSVLQKSIKETEGKSGSKKAASKSRKKAA